MSDRLTKAESEQIHHVTRQATRHAMEDLLLAMGVDVSNPEAIREMQRDMAWVRRGRMSADQTGHYVRRAVIWSIVGGILYAIGTYIIRLFEGNPPFK